MGEIIKCPSKWYLNVYDMQFVGGSSLPNQQNEIFKFSAWEIILFSGNRIACPMSIVQMNCIVFMFKLWRRIRIWTNLIFSNNTHFGLKSNQKCTCNYQRNVNILKRFFRVYLSVGFIFRTRSEHDNRPLFLTDN